MVAQIMLRCGMSRFVRRVAPVSGQIRLNHSEKPGTERKKPDLAEDERWLEAELEGKLRTPEERYAHERQREAIKTFAEKLREQKK
uniref:Uncharacterized protein n=1 Tax=Trypanosoma vivax (strain Y486) TaxID=1055687 RepID=G0U5U8_TRYVY|nr:conserved hypothetical protein [Trypanosoma vivax Y486]